MADVAIGRPCAGCGTLLALAGAFTDETLQTTCQTCGKLASIANPQHAPSPIYPPLMAHLRTLSIADQADLHTSLTAADGDGLVERAPSSDDELFDEQTSDSATSHDVEEPEAPAPEPLASDVRVMREPSADDALFDEPHTPSEAEAADLGRPEGD